MGLLLSCPLWAQPDEGEVILSGAINYTFRAENYSLVGFQGSPLQPDPSQPCIFKLDLWGTGLHTDDSGTHYDDDLTQLSLTAQLPEGLPMGKALSPKNPLNVVRGGVGSATLNAQPWEDESAEPDWFFIRMQVPEEFARPEVRQFRPVGSQFFRSVSGTIAMGAFPDIPHVMEFYFNVELIENVGARYGPRSVQAEGRIRVPLHRDLTGALGGLTPLLDSDQSRSTSSSYLCRY
jgi:hypothetical protein